MRFFDTIIFDLDGVIINSEILWDRSSHEFLKWRGLKYERAQIKHLCTGKSLLEGTRIIQEHYQLPGKTSELAQERKDIVSEFYKTQLEFIPGFQEFIRILQEKKLKYAIATSCNPDLLKLADNRLGLTSIFQPHIYTIADVNHVSKPNPDLFLFTAEKLDSPPTNCVVIEDSPNGVLAAKRAGMFCVALTGTYTNEVLAEADFIARSYAEIGTFLFSSG